MLGKTRLVGREARYLRKKKKKVDSSCIKKAHSSWKGTKQREIHRAKGERGVRINTELRFLDWFSPEGKKGRKATRMKTTSGRNSLEKESQLPFFTQRGSTATRKEGRGCVGLKKKKGEGSN